MAFMDAVFGGLAGAGAALEDIGTQRVKQAGDIDLVKIRAEIEMERDRRLSEYRKGEFTHQAQTSLEYGPRQKVDEQKALAPGVLEEARGKSDIAVDEAKRKPRTIAAGATEKTGDQTYTAPEKPHPQEWLDYMAANARRLNAEAAAIDEGRKYRDKGEKPAVPRIHVEKDSDGNIINVDQNSGAIGVIVPGAPATPEKTHWFSPDEPATPAGQPTIEWSLHGKRLSGGLSDLYPAIRERIGGRAVADPRGSPTSAGSDTRTGWDTVTKDVYVGGVRVGTASTEAEARRMVKARRPPLSSSGPAPFMDRAKETPADVDMAKKPEASAARSPGEEFVSLRRGGYYVDAPIRSPASALNGQSFPSREAALEALRTLYDGL